MFGIRGTTLALAASVLMLSGGCRGDAGANASEVAPTELAVTVQTAAGAKHVFNVEVARTAEEQERGLMYRTGLPADGGMIFTPYPAEGGEPVEASFWMRNTPSPLDILFIRRDGTVARIAENTVPFSEDRILSGEPVSAVLEINGGKSAELGIAPGDKVTWAGQGG